MFSQREDNTEAAAVKGILREISDDEFTLRSLNLPGNEVWYRFPTGPNHVVLGLKESGTDGRGMFDHFDPNLYQT